MNSSKKQKHLLRFERAEVRQYKHFPDGEEVLMGVTPDAFLTCFQSRYWAAPGSNFQNVFSYGGWGSEGDKMSFPWSGENPINLQLNVFPCSRPLVYFIKPMPASVLFCFVLFLYGAIHLGGQSNDLLFALDSVSIDSHLVYLWT